MPDSMESNISEEKPMTNDKEDSSSEITLQESNSDVSSVIVSEDAPVIENKGEHDTAQQNQTVSEDSNHFDANDVVSSKENPTGVQLGTDQNTDCNSGRNEKSSEAIVRISRPLCADYRSESDTESIDSESDSSTSADETTDSSSDGESESESDDSHDSKTANTKTERRRERKAQKDTALADLPPIEDLKISVPEHACVEVGKISGIVDLLVVVESYKGSAALDVATVLFLDCGKRTLGKVFDILGPITEPVYTVRFNSEEQIKSLNIEKEQRVYYAPKTPHTNFVFLSEVLKNKGSDASWKDNIEAPSEFQDFSDDEEERLYKNKEKKESVGDITFTKESNNSRKRSFNRTKQAAPVLNPPRPRHPFPSLHWPPRHQVPASSPPPRLPYNIPPYPGTHLLAAPPPPFYHPPHISGPPFPAFGGLPFHPPFHQPFQPPFQQPFFQQRSHPWGRQMFRPPPPPPPPPPPETQNNDGNP